MSYDKQRKVLKVFDNEGSYADYKREFGLSQPHVDALIKFIPYFRKYVDTYPKVQDLFSQMRTASTQSLKNAIRNKIKRIRSDLRNEYQKCCRA